MNSRARIAAALSFRTPDRLPRFFASFWPQFTQAWRSQDLPSDLSAHLGSDLFVVAADETAWPSRAALVSKEDDCSVIRTGWGVLEKRYPSLQFSELIEPALPQRVDPEKLVFDDPLLESRYARASLWAGALLGQQRYFYCKTGGPYLRAAMMRGEEAFWMDMMDDPGWVKALVRRVTDHLIAVGVESLRRCPGAGGLAIYDDIASNRGLVMGPALYEEIFLPELQRMVAAYRAAGAGSVMHHSDGNVSAVLDAWVAAGIDAANPIEHRAGMVLSELAPRYRGKLALVGGLDNCSILPRGDRGEIRDHVQSIIDAGRQGGVVIAAHSIGGDVSCSTMQYVLDLLQENGQYA